MSRIQFKVFALVAGSTAAAWLLGLWATADAGVDGSRAFMALVASGVFALLASRRIAHIATDPLVEIADITRRIADGDSDARLLWNLQDERDMVANRFNRMADRVQQDLDASRRNVQQLEAVMAEMIEGVLVLDSSDRIVLVNNAFRELFSVWGEVQDRPVVELVRLPAVDDLLSRARDSALPVFEDVDVRGHVHRTVWGRAARFPRAGPRAGTLAVFHDVTEIRRVDRVRSDFIANASHELRTPLTSIQGYVESLASGPMDPAEVKAHLEVIQRNAHRMRDLIDDLMDLSRIESGGGAPDPSSVDVVKLARTLVADATPRLARAKLEAHVRSQDAPAAWADRKAVEQVLENLLTNAIRYSDEGGSISIDVERRGEMLEVSVEDTGIGIPEEALDRIFERFYRVDASRSRAIGSTGLGLSIVRHLVQALGGTIRVESRLGHGSRFTFTLPRSLEATPPTPHPPA